MAVMAQEAVAVPAPAKPRPRSRVRQQRRVAGGALWILLGGILLAGVVFVNLAVLRLNLSLDKATQERTNLRAANAGLQSELSAALASPRIQAQARRQDGLAPADPSTFGHISLGR